MIRCSSNPIEARSDEGQERPTPPPGLSEEGYGSHQADTNRPMCAVCLIAIDPNGEHTYRTPCGHAFHDRCIARWHSTPRTGAVTCPLCRQPLSDENGIIDFEEGPDALVNSEDSSIDQSPGVNAGRDGIDEATEDFNIDSTEGDDQADTEPGPGFEPAEGPEPTRLDIHIARQGPRDGGIPASIPPPECFSELCREISPCLVVHAEAGPGPHLAPCFSGTCPWIQGGRRDASAVGEVLSLIVGRTEQQVLDLGSRVCPACERGFCNSRVVGTSSGEMYHETCWNDRRTERRGYIAWTATWGTDDGARYQSEDIPTVLMLGQNGSTTQAMLAELRERSINARLIMCCSVAHDRLDLGNSITTLVAAADAAWGSRIVSTCDAISWASRAYFAERDRGPKRRLLICETWTRRPWRPGEQPIVRIPIAPTATSVIGCLVCKDDEPAIRNAFTCLAARSQRREAFSIAESLIRTPGPNPQTGAWATEHVQIMISGPVGSNGQELLTNLRRMIRMDAQAAEEILWWDDSFAHDSTLLPVDKSCLNLVIEDLKQGLSRGFPNMMVATCLHGVLISGVGNRLLPGLLTAIGLHRQDQGLGSTLRRGTSYPLRIANHGGPLSNEEQWVRLSAASVDNDTTVVLERVDLDGLPVKRAIEQAVCHSVCISRAQAYNDSLANFEDVWLIRIPQAAGAALRRWIEGGMRTIVGEVRVTARPAPLTRACVGLSVTEDRNAEAATAQRAWETGLETPSSHPIYARLQKRGWLNNSPEVRRLTETTGRGILAERRISDTRLPGVQIDATVLQTFDRDGTPDANELLSILGGLATRPAGTGAERRRVTAIPMNEGGGARFTTGQTVAFAVPRGTEVHIRSFTHDAYVYCPTPRIFILTLDAAAGSNAATAGYDDTIQISCNTNVRWAFMVCPERTTHMHQEPTPAPRPEDDHGIREVSPSLNLQSDIGPERGGPQWRGQMQVLDWVAEQIGELRDPGADGPTNAQQTGPFDEEERLALAILQLYAPIPPSFLIRKLANWIRQHAGTLACGNVQPQWMWGWILLLWTLNECGIHLLAATQPEHYHDLVAQLEAPAWARNSVPFVHWRRGRPSMTAGHLYAGMRRADGAGQLLEQLAPVLPQSIVDALQAVVDGAQQALTAESGEGEGDGVDHTTQDTQAQVPAATPRDPLPPPPPSQAPPANTGTESCPREVGRQPDNWEVQNQQGHTAVNTNDREVRSQDGAMEISDQAQRRSAPDNDEGAVPDAVRRRTSGPTRVDADNQTNPGQNSTAERQGPWLHQILRPHRLTIQVARGIGLTRDCPSHWPQMGRGHARVPGGPLGQEINACAISTCCQLIASVCNRAIPDHGGLAHAMRAWLRLQAGDTIPIADAWWLIAARAFGVHPQPRLLILNTGARVVRDPDLTVAIGPGIWDGRYVAAVGSGSHFDPLWWRQGNAIQAIATGQVQERLSSRITLQTDAGPAAAFLIGTGSVVLVQVDLHPLTWTGSLDTETIDRWGQEVDAAVNRLTPEDRERANGWKNNCIAFACVTPDPAPLLGNDRPTPALYQLVHAVGDMRTRPHAAAEWILAADPDRLWLARANPLEVCQNMLNAAIGRGTA